MPQTVSSLVAPSPAGGPWLDARPVTDVAAVPGSATPFARTRVQSPIGWIVGLLFGLVCLGAGLVVVVALAVVGVALAVGGLVGRWLRAVQARRVPAGR